MSTRLSLALVALSLTIFSCTSREPSVPPIDFAALSEPEKRLPENATAAFTLHEGLGVQLFAAEPMMINPTNLDVDERGRVWICEAQNYRRFNHDHPAREAGDRILIMEDLDRDGSADTAKVFYQGPEVNAALGIAKLGNKVYVAASPNMLVFTDADGDDVPEKLDTLFTGIDGVDHDHGVHAIVFGPDGKLYFNFGNAGKQLRMKNGEPARDLRGGIVEEGVSHRQGMIFRCNPDGSELEILAHNFRNNFEVALDDYGRMWQSDNDDDGNEGTRINYVMDYGNYGYHDEITGAAWQQPRVGMDKRIPLRHWHLNDPGVVPNLLQTGSGSPTGIMIYGGDQLPDVLHGQMIHCEPGHNVVRAYPTEPDGAGYRAEILKLMESQDQWFRPSDVCAAPDGSLLVSDWYDSGVGGHLMADIERGRVFRLHATGVEDYRVSVPDLTDLDAAIGALDHVNQATRYLAYQRVLGDVAAPAKLRALVETHPRAAWLLADIEGSMASFAALLLDSERTDARELALRMARQYPGEGNAQLYAAIESALTSPEPALHREAALGLRFLEGPRADGLYADLARLYDGQDRWYLEALGIASDRYAAQRYAAWMATEPDLGSPAANNLLWRSRAPQAVAEYRRMLEETDRPEEAARYVRALHFHDPAAASPVIEELIFADHAPGQEHKARYALASIAPQRLQQDRRLKNRVTELMPTLRGSDVWLMVAGNTQVASEGPILLDSALVSDDNDFREEAVQIAFTLAGPDYYLDRFGRANATERGRMVDLARYLGAEPIMNWLKDIRRDTTEVAALRQSATRSLANRWSGMAYLLEELPAGDTVTETDRFTARVLSQAWRSNIRTEAIAWLAEHQQGEAIDLDAVARTEGDPRHGEAVFTEYCAACHQVNDEGVRFGPNLSRIGEKLGPDALVAAIAYPSQGIGFGYEGYELTLADGSKLVGYIESQTENDLTVRTMGGISNTVDKQSITNRRPLEESLMTAGLHTIMEEAELADLITYLKGLQLSK